MQRMILLVMLLLGSVTVRAQELGAGYNNDMAGIYAGLIAKSGAKWVRAFVNVQRNYLEFDDANPSVITGVLDANIAQAADNVSGGGDNLAIAALRKFIALKTVKVAGEPVKLILTLKLDFKHGCVKNPPPEPSPLCAGVPEPGTPAAEDLRTAIHARLLADNLGKYIDILVMDNEPMLETPDSPDDAVRYGHMLNVLIADVTALRNTEHAKDPGHWNFEVFVGALNQPSSNPTNPVLLQVIDLVNNNTGVDGLDMHLHVASLDEADADLAFVRDTKGVTKKIISTEFSLIGLWNTWRDKPLAGHGRKGDCPDGVLLHSWINTLMQRVAAGDPIRQKALLDCFKAQPWYPDRWFKAFYGKLQKYGVYAATYGLQEAPPFPVPTLDDKAFLWVLNGVYNGALLGLSGDGFYNTNPLVYPEFREIAKKQNKH